MDQENQTTNTVLIVEDENDIREVYAEVLREAGYSVIEANDGSDGAELIKQGNWNLLLLDIMLPGEDGLHILKELKADPNQKSKPAILLTNLGSEPIINEAFNLGADGYLIKSEITPDKIVSEVDNYISRS